MKYIYSPSTNSMYPLDLKDDYITAGSWPKDGVELSDEEYREFSKNPPEGMMLASVDGFPSWVEIPPPTHDELVAIAESKKEFLITQANDYMNSKQWPGKAALGRLKGDDLEKYNKWLDYLDEIDTVDSSTAPDIAWPSRP